MRCSKCCGIGLIKRKCIFLCKSCNDKYNSCYRCENKNKSIWIECENCYGTGNYEHQRENKLKHKYINEIRKKSI